MNCELGTSCKLAPAGGIKYDDWLNDLDFPENSKYGAQYLNSLGW